MKSTFKSREDAKEMLAEAARYLIGEDDRKTTIFTPAKNGTTLEISMRLWKVRELNALRKKYVSKNQTLTEADIEWGQALAKRLKLLDDVQKRTAKSKLQLA